MAPSRGKHGDEREIKKKKKERKKEKKKERKKKKRKKERKKVKGSRESLVRSPPGGRMED